MNETKMLPDFIIIGAQKSASTYLQSCIAEHPDIYIPNGETPFFESPDYEENKGNVEKLASVFNASGEKTLGIKRPNYLGKPEVPKRIQKHLPNVKLIVVLRNPIDRAISAYFHYMKMGLLPILDVENGLKKALNDEYFKEKYPVSKEIVDFGLYGLCLYRYKYFYQKNQILILFHDNIAKR